MTELVSWKDVWPYILKVAIMAGSVLGVADTHPLRAVIVLTCHFAHLEKVPHICTHTQKHTLVQKAASFVSSVSLSVVVQARHRQKSTPAGWSLHPLLSADMSVSDPCCRHAPSALSVCLNQTSEQL